MIGLGTALKSTEDPYHRLVVLSDPRNNGGQVVLVRVTTDDGSWPDRDCILEPADWMELEHRSTVAYSTAKFGPVLEKLEQAVQRRTFRTISSPPIDTLRKMIAAGRTAKGMPPGAVRWLANLPDTTPLVSPASSNLSPSSRNPNVKREPGK